jgi:hypothetical protein
MQRGLRIGQVAGAVALVLGLWGCNPQDILGDCEIVTDNFAGSYGPSDQRSHRFRVDCAGTITLFWTCPQCPDPNAGLLLLLDPVGNEALSIDGAGFRGQTRTHTTILEGTWTLLLQGTGGGFVNNYSVDVTYPAR